MGAKLNVSTFPQLLGRHYRSRGIQVFVAAVIFLGMPLYAAVVMKVVLSLLNRFSRLILIFHF